LRYYPGIFLDGLRETLKPSFRIAGILAEIRAVHIPNTSLEHYRQIRLLGYVSIISKDQVVGLDIYCKGEFTLLISFMYNQVSDLVSKKKKGFVCT
jgi:hypothetical protein